MEEIAEMRAKQQDIEEEDPVTFCFMENEIKEELAAFRAKAMMCKAAVAQFNSKCAAMVKPSVIILHPESITLKVLPVPSVSIEVT